MLRTSGAYHEAYWVVAATTAPVIALAAILSMSDIGRVLDKLEGERSWFAADSYDRERRKMNLVLNLQLINVSWQAATLAISLISIKDQATTGIPDLEIVFLIGGMACLVIAQQAVSSLRTKIAQVIGNQRGLPKLTDDLD
jgi:hypothetical protein